MRNTNKGTLVPLVHLPSFVHATLWLHGDVRSILVYRSPVVDDADSCMKRVFAYFDVFCFWTGVPEIVRDEFMMFGYAERTIHELYDVCPGGSVPHNCRFERAELNDTMS